MYRFILGVVFGVYLEQQYKLPNVLLQLKEFEKYLVKNYKIKPKDSDENI